MSVYKCLVVDDNEIERDAIEMYLRKIPKLDIIAICSTALEAIDVLQNQHIDIVFSDIDMPELSGLDLLKSIKNPPIFIFITSYAEYAAEGFNLDALDFVVKPATFERLLKASNKAIDYLELKSVANNNELQHTEKDTDDYFYIKETKGFTRLNYADVVYIESMGDFSRIYTATNKHITLVNLKNLERQLPSIFVRVHKQFIINLNQIATVANAEIYLNHDYTVPVSLLNKHDLMEKITKKAVTRHGK
jgi:two-component system LytT family response regulator